VGSDETSMSANSSPEGATYLSPGRKSGVEETKDNSALPKALAGEHSSQAIPKEILAAFVRAGQPAAPS
jgi:hypothetical protein